MAGRIAWIVIVLSASPLAVADQSEPTVGLLLWQKGQAALAEGDPAKAIACFEASLLAEPSLTRNYLSLAACRLALGQDEQALVPLARYLELQPDHHAARSHHAELLLRLGRREQARHEFEKFAALVDVLDDSTRQHLVHCHTRLMEIAESDEDAYRERLHRGIGLYHLAQQRARMAEEDAGLSVESILCRAAGELTQAWREKPDEPRACWYLYCIWSQLAQSQPAARWLRAAQSAAELGDLTPVERAGLQLANRTSLATSK